MSFIHICGRRNSGKTTLVTDVVKELTSRGLRVATVKHSAHAHQIDKPGKDSFLHREAGANPAAIITADGYAVFGGRTEGEEPLAALAPLLQSPDIVIVEGYVAGPGRKVEVYRSEVNANPVFTQHKGIEAVITDETVETNLPIWPRDDISKIADGILELSKSDTAT